MWESLVDSPHFLTYETETSTTPSVIDCQRESRGGWQKWA